MDKLKSINMHMFYIKINQNLTKWKRSKNKQILPLLCEQKAFWHPDRHSFQQIQFPKPASKSYHILLSSNLQPRHSLFQKIWRNKYSSIYLVSRSAKINNPKYKKESSIGARNWMALPKDSSQINLVRMATCLPIQ